MSDSTISQLPAAGPLTGAEFIPVDQGGITKRTTAAQLGNGTVIIAPGKTLYVSNTLTLAGTDGVTVIFPSTNASIARTDAGQTFTGTQVFTSIISGSINGNAGTATALQTARAINGVNFDGTAAITVPVNNADDTTTNATMYPLWTATVGGNYAAKVSSTKLTFNPSTGLLTATGFAGPLTGNVTGNVSGSSGSTTGNAATATALQTARTIDGTSFDGTANILVVAPAIHAASSKATPVDADEDGIWDSVSGLLNKVTWANRKATLKTYFDTIYAALAGSATQTFAVAAATAAAHAVRKDQTHITSETPAFGVYQSTLQSVPNTTFTKIQFQTEEFDTNNAFDNVTNYRFQPTTAGYYQISFSVSFASSSSITIATLYKNGARFKDGTNGTLYSSNGDAVVSLNGSTDYLEVYGFQASGGALNTSASQYETHFSGCLMRPL